MGELAEDINKNSKILLARNTPVALVCGAASFFGSNLVNNLLLKDIQVIGVDDLTYDKRENLSTTSESKNFHLIIESAENLDLELDRLDYIFIIPQKELNFKKALDLLKKFKSRLLLISSIELYDEEKTTDSLKGIKKIESAIARVAKEDNLNARILRLGSVFGPNMNFDQSDPLIRLIWQSLTGDLQKDVALEFSSRALYIDDACALAIKCILSGSTAQKIFDGVLPTPVKVSEIKQVLMDPVWYESRDFIPTELPPWPSPNLEKTIKFLNWYPKNNLISNLRKTLSYFRDHEIRVPKLEDGGWRMEVGKEDGGWKLEKAEQLEGLKSSEEKKPKKGTDKLWILLGLSIFISYALLWPIAQMGWGILTFRFQLLEAVKSLEKGEFEKSLLSVKQAANGVEQAKSIFYSLEPLRQTGFLKSQFELGDNLANLATLSTDSAQNTIKGIQSLYQSLKSITGELNESPKVYFDPAQTYLASADRDLSKADALISNQDFLSGAPKILKTRVESLSERLSLYSNLVKKSRALAILMPEAVGLDSSKNYLVLLQNNHELRATGGLIGSVAKVSFEAGKLKKLEVNDVYAIDGQLKMHVEPPKEIKNDLSQKDYYLRDSNWEPDFPTSARQAEWFYTKETGERVEGVVAIDISAMEDLLSVLGSSENLFGKDISKVASSLFNKLFFLPNQNWPAIATSLGRSLNQKHISIYLDNSLLFSYVISQNWGAVLPRTSKENNGSTKDFLAPVEANLGTNKANYYLDRRYSLETVIGKDGEVSHRLRISYTNRSPSESFPGGKYKNRMRVYLPMGAKLTKASWGEVDIHKDVESFVDYGRSGYSFLIELLPKEQKMLVLDYQTPLKLEFKENKADYRLDVVKQAGTYKDPFVWKVVYPIDMKVISESSQKIGPQEYSIQTDLSTDKTFKLEFTR